MKNSVRILLSELVDNDRAWELEAHEAARAWYEERAEQEADEWEDYEE